MLIFIPEAFREETIKELQDEGKEVFEWLAPLFIVFDAKEVEGDKQ